MWYRSDSSFNDVKSVDTAENIMTELTQDFTADSICKEGNFVFVHQPDVLYSDFASAKSAGHLKRRMTKAQEVRGGVSRSVANVHGEVDVTELVRKVEKACGYKVMQLDGTSKIMLRLKIRHRLHVDSSTIVAGGSPSDLGQASIPCGERKDKRGPNVESGDQW